MNQTGGFTLIQGGKDADLAVIRLTQLAIPLSSHTCRSLAFFSKSLSSKSKTDSGLPNRPPFSAQSAHRTPSSQRPL